MTPGSFARRERPLEIADFKRRSGGPNPTRHRLDGQAEAVAGFAARRAQSGELYSVRMKVARFELTPATPILPNSAVRPAKNADPIANNVQCSINS